MTITASGRILYSPVLESLHPMDRIVGDREDRPYDSMTDIACIGYTEPPRYAN
jgi:hypothetical protein